jgi:hypothetical protein
LTSGEKTVKFWLKIFCVNNNNNNNNNNNKRSRKTMDKDNSEIVDIITDNNNNNDNNHISNSSFEYVTLKSQVPSLVDTIKLLTVLILSIF